MIIVLSALKINAQIERLGTPVSWNIGHNVLSNSIWQTYPTPDIAALIAEDEQNTDKTLPFRFAYSHDVNLNIENAGQWTNLTNGDRIWTLAIECSNALTVGLIFGQIDIPRGSKIYIYSEDHRDYIGPITNTDNRNSELGLSPIKGSKIILEYYEPYAYRGLGYFNIQHISHGYRDIGEFDQDESSSCEILPVESSLITSKSASVLRMFVDKAQRIATATLVNNTGNNGLPFVMTATSALLGSPSSWVFQFNVTRNQCASQPITCEAMSINGASVVRSDANTGITLLRLKSKPINDWSVYYSGIKITPETFVSNFRCIQHALGIPQSICYYESGLENSEFHGYDSQVLGSPVSGRTTYGSVGSPLFDDDFNLVGIYLGGNSDCFENGVDHFGVISTCWTQFREFLDPRQSTSDRIEGGYSHQSPELVSSPFEVSFFPNPANTWIYIVAEDENNLPEVRIYDAAGREVIRTKPIVPTLDISNLPKGLYAISFFTKNDMITKSLLIR